MKAIVIAMTCAACVDIGAATPWQDLSTISGELAPEAGPDPMPRAAPCRLRVATWNVHFADDVTNLAAQLAGSSHVGAADILLVQEIRRFTSEPASRAEMLARALGMTWVYVPAHPVDGGGVHGVAILSKFPLINTQMRELPYVSTINAERRIALRADMLLDGDPLPVVDVHLDTRLAPVDRIRQLDPALQDLGDRMVIGGDLNTLPWTWVNGAVPLTGTSAVVDQKQAQVVDDYFAQNGFTRAIGPDVVTARSRLVNIRLDDIYARGFPVLAGDVEHVDGSDHWPVWFELDRCHGGSLASQ